MNSQTSHASQSSNAPSAENMPAQSAPSQAGLELAQAQQDRLDRLLAASSASGSRDDVAQWISAGANPKAFGSAAIELAARAGHARIVELLIPLSNPLEFASPALFSAAKGGHAECVRLLLPASTTFGGSQALCIAARHGYADCVALLIPHSDPLANNSKPLREAASLGHTECVRLLIPSSNPTDERSWALVAAAASGIAACADLLAPLSDLSALVDQAIPKAANSHPEVLAALLRWLPLGDPELFGLPKLRERALLANKLASASILEAFIISRSTEIALSIGSRRGPARL